MTGGQAMRGMVQLFRVFLCLGLGTLLVGLGLAPKWALAFEHILFTRPDLFAFAGVVLIGCSVVFSLVALRKKRGRMVLLRMGTSVDVKLVCQTLMPLFHKQFEEKIRLRDVQLLRGNELSIALQLAPMESFEREKQLLEAERCLQRLLIERFGFSRPFSVQAEIL